MGKFSLKNSFLAIVVLVVMAFSSGCVYMVIGGVGALGGYAISPDTVEGNVSGNTAQDLWDASVEVVSIMGIIEEKNEISGVLIAKIHATQVTVSISEPITDMANLRVKARKGMMPKIKLAQDVYTKIVQSAN